MPQLPSKVQTISLIGMPGAGKSTVGVVLAKMTGLQFRDTDLDIQVREGATLQQILDRSGYQHLRAIEQEVLLALDPAGAVISTGGSAVYSDLVMAHLSAAGPLVYLRASLATLLPRVAATPDRGIASPGEQSFEQIYTERCSLYEQHADVTVDVDAANPEALAANIIAALN